MKGFCTISRARAAFDSHLDPHALRTCAIEASENQAGDSGAGDAQGSDIRTVFKQSHLARGKRKLYRARIPIDVFPIQGEDPKGRTEDALASVNGSSLMHFSAHALKTREGGALNVSPRLHHAIARSAPSSPARARNSTRLN